MSQIPPTITLEIGLPDQTSGEYPLRLLFHGQQGLEEKATAKIAGATLERGNLDPDPVRTILETVDDSADFEKIGENFYKLLHQGDVATAWDAYKANHRRLRIQLDIKPPLVASLPWELICSNLDRFAVDPEQTLIRTYTPTRAPEKLKPDSWPIRVLIVVGAKDEDLDVLPLEEIRWIESQIYKYDRQDPENHLVHRVIDIEILKRPSPDQLKKVYKTDFKPHVFHFIGHGGINANNKAYLVINHLNPLTSQFEPIHWTVDDIMNDIRDWKWTPRFVFINSCRSESKNQDYEENKKQAWSIGDIFRRLGVPAVLTMQADINGRVAGVFAGSLYKSLAELDPLDTALGHARSSAKTAAGGFDKREWAIPVLTVAVPPEEILPLKPKAEHLNEIKNCTAFKEIEVFSDRQEERRRLIRGFYPLPPEIENRDLIVVKGGQETGKSWLVKWGMEACALLNHDIRYVEVGGEDSKTWLDILFQIRFGNEGQRSSLLLHNRLDDAAFQRFHWEIESRFKGHKPPPAWDGTVVPPRQLKVADPDAKWTPDFIEETFKSFRTSLVQSAKINNPLIIVMDHFTKNGGVIEGEMVKYLIPNLLVFAAKKELRDKISDNEVRAVKFILVLTEGEYEDFKIKELIGGNYDVELTNIEPKHYEDAAKEYLYRIRDSKKVSMTDEQFQDMLKIIQYKTSIMKSKNERWPISKLGWIEREFF
jgi:hypothetical protein